MSIKQDVRCTQHSSESVTCNHESGHMAVPVIFDFFFNGAVIRCNMKYTVMLKEKKTDDEM